MKKSLLLAFSLLIMLITQSCSTTQNLSSLTMSKTYTTDQGTVRGSTIEELKSRGYNYDWKGNDLIVGIKKIEYYPNSVWSTFGKGDKKIRIQALVSSVSSADQAMGYGNRLARLRLTLVVQEKNTNGEWNTVNIKNIDSIKAYFKKLFKDIDKNISINPNSI